VVAGKTLRFRKAIIATGSRPAQANVLGLAEAGFLTNETVFSLSELPRRLAIIGAGPIGCEMAQAFARFGSEVSLLANHAHILPRDDPQAAGIVEEEMARDGVRLLHDCAVTRVHKQGSEYHLIGRRRDEDFQVGADAILVAVGRAPNVDGLDLEAAGIAYDARRGVQVNDRLQTSNHRVFAAGDICTQFRFTHAADAMARIAVQNALFLGRARASTLTIPWCTYTDPEVAHVGLSEEQAKATGIPIRTFVQEMAQVDRAVLDGQTNGFVKVHVRSGTDRIVGATVVARHAGEMIAELVLAMVGRLGLRILARTIHAYPTQADAIKKVADAYNRTRLTPLVRWLFDKWLSWRR
jgi:pyruvate/2-oxoglutarate dehydrogenase complex dihydrolipoamide dehydrogenase (E3) component